MCVGALPGFQPRPFLGRGTFAGDLRGRFNVLVSDGLSQLNISPLKRAEYHIPNAYHAVNDVAMCRETRKDG